MDKAVQIQIDENKCKKCFKCIAVCPVKFCNTINDEFISVNHDLCIFCGKCIVACPHNARKPKDDLKEFLNDIRKTDIICILDPSYIINFSPYEENFITWLRNLGAEKIYNARFGANISAFAYDKEIEENGKHPIISTNCPAIINYIEKLRPELAPYLSKALGPTAISAKTIKNNPGNGNSKIAVISPCISKTTENVYDYSITFKSIKDYLEKNNINISELPPSTPDIPPYEFQSDYPMPQSLSKLLKKHNKTISTRTIDGRRAFNYINNLHNAINNKTTPQFIELYSCDFGCCNGTASSRKTSIDEFEKKLGIKTKQNFIERIKEKIKIKNILKKIQFKIPHRKNQLKIASPSKLEKNRIFLQLGKNSDEKIYNCRCCGYDSCETMACAIFLNANTPENCIKNKTQNLSQDLTEKIHINSKVNTELNSINNFTKKIEEKMNELIKNIQTETNNLNNVIKDFENLKKIISNFEPIANSINDISERINILSLNATIEAHKASIEGAGFKIVANEIKKLALKSKKETLKIKPYSDLLKEKITNVSAEIDETTNYFFNITEEIKNLIKNTDNIFEQLSKLEEYSSTKQSVKNN